MSGRVVRDPTRAAARTPAPVPFAAWYPWADKKGRTSAYRGTVFALLLLPALWLGVRWAIDDLGARPLTEVLHRTGDWTVWFLLLSLLVTPARAILAEPRATAVRRMVGLGTLAYGGVHLLLYVADQNWRPLAVISEIVLRFYLLIGFIALLGLAVLGWTSTDNWVKRLGAAWKPLHKVVYALAVLAVAHFVLQSKADVSRAILAAGLLIWLLLWRALPAGRDRGPLPLLGLTVVAAALTLLLEWAWYRFGTTVDALRVIRGELDISFGLHPVDQVIALGLVVVCVSELRRLALAGHGQAWWFHVLLYAGGAVLANVTLWALNLVPVDDGLLPFWAMALAWLALFAGLGLVRGLLPAEGGGTWPPRTSLDVFCALLLAYPLWVGAVEYPRLAQGLIAVGVAAALGVALRLWPVSRLAAGLVLPAIAWVAYAGCALP